MTDRAGLSRTFRGFCVFALLLAPALAQAADQPAATAVIPPAALPTVMHTPTLSSAAMRKTLPPAAVHQPPHAAATATAGKQAKPRHAAAKTNARTAAVRATDGRKPDAVAQHDAKHRATARRPVVAHSGRPPPAPLPGDYAGVPMPGPDGPPPPLPPPWYDRARPAIAFAYPPPLMGPRGPMPWWVR